MKRLTIGILFVAVAAFLFGCGGGSAGSSNAPDPEVRFFNGVSDSDGYDFLMEEDVEATDIDFEESTPDFKKYEARTRLVTARETGTTNEIWVEDFTLQDDKHYVISTLGLENYGSEPLKRARLFMHEVNREAPNGSIARLYVVHGFAREAGFETPNIDFQNPGNNPQFRITDIPFGEARFINVDAVNQTFEARRAGTEAIFATTNFTFEAGKIYIAYVLGVESGVGAQAPQIQIVELSAD